MFKEILRPKLVDAVSRLREGYRVLKQHADSYLVFPSVRRHRSLALEQFEGLVNDLDWYLQSLGNWHGGGSGSAIGELEQLQGVLKDRPSEIADISETLLLGTNRTQLFSVTQNCARTIEALRIAFR